MSSDGEIMFSKFGQVWKTLLEFRKNYGIIKTKLGKTIENKWRYRHEKSTKIFPLQALRKSGRLTEQCRRALDLLWRTHGRAGAEYHRCRAGKTCPGRNRQRPRDQRERRPVSYTHLDVYKRQVLQYGNELISLGILPLAMEEAQIFSQVALVVGQIATWICVLFTLISGAIYLWDNREFVKTAK